jgi:CubicO group peptidase (beta-lactamase class C family)
VAWDPAGLSALEAFVADTRAGSFVLRVGGETLLAYERDPAVTFTRDIASVQKSLVAILVGRAVAEGLLTLATDTGLGGAEAVTVEHLLTMTSGLDQDLLPVASPGTTWYYNTVAYGELHRLLEEATGQSMGAVAAEWLFDPVGAKAARVEPRPAAARGAPVAPNGFVCGAADLVAVGEAVLAAAEPVLTPTWKAAMLAPSQTLNPSYGYLWWLNGQAGQRQPGPDPPLLDGPLVPGAPVDLVAGFGAGDQKLYLVPSLDLVCARLGEPAGPIAQAGSAFDAELWQAILSARTV